MSTDPDKSPDQIRAEIDTTREELGDTVEALAEKTDVKARAKDKAEYVKAEATARFERNPKPLATAGGLVILFLVWRWVRS